MARVPGSGERVESGPFLWEAAAVAGAESAQECAGTRRRPKRRRRRRGGLVVVFGVVCLVLLFLLVGRFVPVRS